MNDKATQPVINATAQLKPDVAQVYKLIPGTQAIGYFPGFGEIDLSKINIETANSLVDRGFKWLLKK